MKKNLIKSILPLATLLFIIIFLSKNNRIEGETYKRTRLMMGTVVEITVLDKIKKGKGKEDDSLAPGESVDAAVEAAFARIKKLEELLGRRQKGSDIWRINRSPGLPVPVSPETYKLIEDSLDFSKISNGAFDVTLGRIIELWDFEGETPTLPKAVDIEAALKGVGAESVLLDREALTVTPLNAVRLDLGAIAKGYIIDEAGKVLLANNIDNFIINAGGDMVIKGKRGSKPWKVGLQHPRDAGKVMAHIEIMDARIAVVTSGDYERYFMEDSKRYHHILDPATGYPASGLMSVTIKALDAKVADALSTAVFVMGAKKGLALIEQLQGVDAVLVDSNENIIISKGLKEKVVIR
ncbi:MAG: FAD:protein FMN transferase [bacterium]|nr:FAD:protein FMN transferase [bacterium]